MHFNSLAIFFVICFMIFNSFILSFFLSLILTSFFHKHAGFQLFLAYYILFSFIEWFAHKYIMHDLHQTNKDHLRHHLSVLPNMNLVKKDEYGDNDFGWPMIFKLTLFAFILSYYYFFKMYGIKARTHFLNLLAGCILITMIWNNVHNAMHCEDLSTSIWEGPPSMISKDTARNLPGFYTLYEHHYRHHILKKPKGNFNIVCLGMDRIMGTEVDKTKMKVKLNECQN